MKLVIVKLRDSTKIELEKDFVWVANMRDELNDTRTQFIDIGNYVIAKDLIAGVYVGEDKE